MTSNNFKVGFSGTGGIDTTSNNFKVGFSGASQGFNTKISQMNASPNSLKPKIGSVELSASAWVPRNDNLYSQIVNIEGITENSQVDLTPDVEQLVVFYQKDLTFVTENDGGVVTVYAIGQKPSNDYTIQVTITEVSV